MKPEDKTTDNADFLLRSRALLDESVESLDAVTLSRLNQARQKALNSRRETKFTSRLLTAPGAAIFAGFALLAVITMLWTNTPQQTTPQPLAQSYEDIQMLTSETDLELLQDLEFVSWLVIETQLDTDIDAETKGAG